MGGRGNSGEKEDWGDWLELKCKLEIAELLLNQLKKYLKVIEYFLLLSEMGIGQVLVFLEDWLCDIEAKSLV